VQRVQQVVDVKTGDILSSKAVAQNSNFVMLFKEKLPLITELIREEPAAASLLFALVSHMSGMNALLMSRQTASELTNMSPRSVTRCYDVLKRRGLISITIVCGSPMITVSAELVWQSHANGRKYALAHAAVVASDGEQRPKGPKIRTASAKIVTATAGQQTLFEMPSQPLVEPERMPNPKGNDTPAAG